MGLSGDPDVFVVVAEVLGWIDPDATVTKDPAMARPSDWTPNTVYVYPDDEEHVRYESGEGIRQNYRLVVDYAVDDADEQASGVRSVAVTTALRARAKAYARAVATRQRTASHDQLWVAGIEWLVVAGTHFRGFRMRLAGYTLWN